MGKRLVLFSMITALLLSGCGKKNLPAATSLGTAASVGAPINPQLADGTAPDAETAPTGMLPADTNADPTQFGTAPEAGDDPADTPSDAASPAAAPSPSADDAEEAAAEKAAEEAAAKKAADEAAAKKAADEAKEAEEEAAQKAEDEAEAAELAAKQRPAFVKDIGDGSLNSANGLVVDGGFIYVVDNARTGLFGKYAAVRQYQIDDGSYTKLSFENIGWMGTKNMPTTVTRVKLVDGNIVAADSANSYVFDPTGVLLKTESATFSQVTQVVDPNTGDTFKINGSKIDRLHKGKVLVSFGSDEIGTAVSIAVGSDGSVFVSEGSKGLIHQYAPAEK